MAQDNGGRLVWFVAGAAVGAAIALLYAPAAGSDTRRKIGERANEGREALRDTGREIYERGHDLYDKGRRIADEAAELFERGRKLVEG